MYFRGATFSGSKTYCHGAQNYEAPNAGSAQYLRMWNIIGPDNMYN